MTLRRRVLAAVVAFAAVWAHGRAETALFSPRLAEVPYSYLGNGTRAWPLLGRYLTATESVQLSARRNGAVLARSNGPSLAFENLTVSVTRDGRLEVTARAGSARFELEIEVRRDGEPSERKMIALQPAPTGRPVSYYADFGDDLVNIFGIGARGTGPAPLHHEVREGGASGRVRLTRGADGIARFDAAGFDAYFRRLQGQGVSHLILWMFPFPFVSDASAYADGDWELYQRHARALLRDPHLAALMAGPKPGIVYWGWLRDLMAFRLDANMHRALSDSAIAHGITLGISYRPFEQAGSKSYELPVFDADGEFLWSFQPLSSPTVNFRPREVGFVHYREMLARGPAPEFGRLAEIHLRGVENAAEFMARFRAQRDNLQIVAANVPPLQADSFVLVRQPDGEFQLQPFREIQERAHARRHVIRDFELRYEADKTIVLSGFNIPSDYQYIILENPSRQAALTLVGEDPVRLVSAGQTTLGRNAVYVAFAGDAPEEKDTRVAGITAMGHLQPVFFAAEASQRYLRSAGYTFSLNAAALVVNRGEPFSREMVDYVEARARENVVRELASVLKYPAFREIYLNTRSHTALVASVADGSDGLRPLVHYKAAGKPYTHLGLDLAYAPRSATRNPIIQSRLKAADTVTALTEFQRGEWSGTCQSEQSPFVWRFARNQGVADGVRALLQDLEAAFPHARLRVVLPEREPVEAAVNAVQANLPAGALSYKRSRNNYIPHIGEGMTLLDLTGLRTEPVLLGVGPAVEPQILQVYLDAALRDLATNRGSSFRGPRGIMYEGQSTLKNEAGRSTREAVMRALLSRPEEINEVIVYEAADWAYRLPFDGFEFLGDDAAR